MRWREYKCGAKVGKATCGGAARDHSINQTEVWSPNAQRMVPQHTFVAVEARSRESEV